MFVWTGHDKANDNPSSLFSQISSDNISQEPLDQISSADIAATVAKVARLPEAVTIVNQADSYNAQIASAIVEEAIVSKPQLVTSGTKTVKDIQKYTTVSGDTVGSLATKFGVTSDSIKWSNALTSDYLSTGKELLIPPINGIVYKVKSTDTVDSIVSTYSSDKEKLIAFNDIEISGLKADTFILVPDGVQPRTTTRSSSSSYTAYNYTPEYGGNGYTYGYCTYYVATRVEVPRNWGNANTWAYYARLSGWTVSSRPIAGAIAQDPGMSYWGHVAYVEEVSADGSMMRYSDMNALAGWNRVGYSDWVPISTFPNYIYR